AEQQVEAVSKKLVELNPGVDGKVSGADWRRVSATPAVVDCMVYELKVVTDNVTDISPLRALKGIHVLLCIGSALSQGKLVDLSPLKGMPLEHLYVDFNDGLSDLSPLQGMKLTRLNGSHTNVADLSPLKDM